MEADELGRRLRVARETRGLSQQAAADRLGLPRTAVTQLEAGKRSVSTLELTRLAQLYLRPVADFLREGARDEDEDVLAALYRVAPDLERDPSTREQIARCVSLCREGMRLERLLGVDSRCGPPGHEPRTPRSSGEAVAQGERTAMQERRRLGIGDAQIADVPELVASQGIRASGVELPNGMSGLFLRHPGTGSAILANSSHPRGRQRFSYAHEYAHALLDRDRNIAVSGTGNSSEMVERRANAFATAFLMPENGVRDALRNLAKGLPGRQERTVFDAAGGNRIEAVIRSPTGSQRITCRDVATIAHRFGVSYQAALHRLASLRHVSRREARDLLEREGFGDEYLKALDMFDEVGERESRRHRDRELRSGIAHLAVEACRRGRISRGRVLELSGTLGIDGDILLRLAEAARGE